MHMSNLDSNKDMRSLKIGNLEAKVPVVQGGMGVGVSLSGLAGAVAKCGGVGIISTAQIGFREPEFNDNPIETNLKAIEKEVKKAKEIANGGIVGVNIMVATKRYEDYVKAAVEAGVDIIISGAGLPMELPKLVEGSDVKIAPIVSGKKSFDVISKYWMKKYQRKPDMVVIEGPLAGGHLGFSYEDVYDYSGKEIADANAAYDAVVKEIIEAVRAFEGDDTIPVVVAGGVFQRSDLEHYLSLGAAGVQMATRFVATPECDASEAYKMAYINAKKEDIVIVKSPVGMPGRAIHNEFIDKVNEGERFMGERCWQCVKTCKPAETPYCITRALVNAVEGNLSEGLIFCGANAFRVDHMETVAQIMEEFA